MPKKGKRRGKKSTASGKKSVSSGAVPSSSDFMLPKSVDEFRSQAYWDEHFRRYEDGADGGASAAAFEWYGEWRDLAAVASSAECGKWDRAAPVLIAGCGNSRIGEDMALGGFARVTAVDYSGVVIETMSARAAAVGLDDALTFEQADLRFLDHADGTYATVVDKACLDAMMADGEDAEGAADGEAALRQMMRVLAPGGRYVCVTLAQSHVLDLLLRTFPVASEGWSIDVHSLPNAEKLLPYVIVVTKPLGTPTEKSGSARAFLPAGDPAEVLGGGGKDDAAIAQQLRERIVREQVSVFLCTVTFVRANPSHHIILLLPVLISLATSSNIFFIIT